MLSRQSVLRVKLPLRALHATLGAPILKRGSFAAHHLRVFMNVCSAS
jgi:hypothetical protein